MARGSGGREGSKGGAKAGKGRKSTTRKASAKGKASPNGKAAPKKGARRKAVSKRASPRKPASRKSSPRRSRATSPRRARRGRRSSWRGRLLRWTAAALAGGLAGAGAVVWVLYHQANIDVEQLLDSPVWSKNGQVLSGPWQVWPGMRLSTEQLAGALQASGYVRSRELTAPGDFVVAPHDVLVWVAQERGAGWALKQRQVHVAFGTQGIAAVSPSRVATFRPAVLANLRGSDNEAREPVTLDEVPGYLVDAVVSMEDARYFEHEGLDPLGIARALVVNAVAGHTVQGGSTLTQQVVKNLFLTQERSYERKAREAVLSIALEHRRTKDEILALYLNEIYLGQVGGAAICGVEEAAQAYFGVPAARLSLGEAATLAGIVSAPNRYSPLNHPERAIERRDLVLQRMVQAGHLDFAEAEREKATPLQVHAALGGRRSPWAVDAAVARAEEQVGEGAIAARGLSVSTTVNPALQSLGERALAEGMAAVAADHPGAAGAQAALVAVRVQDGAILALVGGRSYGDSQFDRALFGARQVGSTVKPLTYLAAFQDDLDLSPSSTVVDEAIEVHQAGGVWRPTNYDHSYKGEITLRQALAESRNIPAVKLARGVGMERLQRQWRSLGLTGATLLPSAALGAFEATPVQIAGAYTIFPGGGIWASPRLLTAISADDDQVLWSDEPLTARRSSASAAFLATSLLQEVVLHGTGRRLARYGLGVGVGGKTGTTDDGRDAWFVGFTHDMVVAVWVGFDKGRALGLTGAQAALPTWGRFVSWSGVRGTPFSPPAGVVSAQVCTQSHLPATLSCPETREEWFNEGHVPKRSCPVHGDALDRAGEAVSGAWSRLKEAFKRR